MDSIRTLEELEEFVYAIVKAHASMMSTDEAIRALKEAFKEYRDHITITNAEQSHQRWTVEE